MPERPLASLSDVVRSARELWSAGRRPKTRPVTTAIGHRESDDSPVERDERPGIADARQVGGVDRQQRAHAGDAEREAEHAADDREQQALGQELPDDAAA